MEIDYIQKWEGYTGHLELKKNITLHKFVNSSFNKMNTGKFNISISNFIINISPEKLFKFSKLYSTFYEIPNACELSQYSEYVSALLYEFIYKATNFITEGKIIKELRNNKICMNGHSPPDIYMSSINGKPTLVSVTRFNSKYDLKRRAYNLLLNKIKKSIDSVETTFPILKTDRCIIQIFCKTEKNAIILKNTFQKMQNIPNNVYIHIVICEHKEIYDNNKLF